MSNSMKWESAFSEREQKEIKFARLYAKDFAHGTTGHNALIVIAKMAEALDILEMQNTLTKGNPA